MLLILVVVFIAFLREWAAPDVVAMTAFAAVAVLGFVPFSDVYEHGVIVKRGLMSVFSNPAPFTVACLFIVSAGLEKTGVLDRVGALFSRMAGGSLVRSLLVLCLVVAFLSAFVNNTPIVVMFLPVVLAHARQTKIPSSLLLIPLSFASILGGTCTMVGSSTNLIIDGIVREHGVEGFSFFEPGKLGLLYLVIGIVYLLLFARLLLPRISTVSETLQPEDFRHYLTQFEVGASSRLLGQLLTDTLLAENDRSKVLEVRRRGQRVELPLNELRIQAGDRLLVTLPGSALAQLHHEGREAFHREKDLGLKELQTQDSRLIEAIIGPRSDLDGKSLSDVKFRQRFCVHVLAIHRHGHPLRQNLAKVKLAFGDTLLLDGSSESLNRLVERGDLIGLSETPPVEVAKGKAWIAGLALGGFVLCSLLKLAPIPALALFAVLVLLVTRCLQPKDAYYAVQWPIVFLIYGMLGVGLAMEQTETAALVVTGLATMFGDASPWMLVGMVYLLSSTLTETISNNAVAALLTPVLLGMAVTLGVEPRPFLVALMFGCSASFVTPIGYQTNTFVFGAGGYRFKDFVKIGLPLNLLLCGVATVLIPLIWPFG